MDKELIGDLVARYERALAERGFHISPFLVGWYNEAVSREAGENCVYRLGYRWDTLAVSVASSGSVFESTFLEKIRRLDDRALEQVAREGSEDLLDVALREALEAVTGSQWAGFARDHRGLEALEECWPVIISDSDMVPVTRQPRIVVRVAGHVSGQARYYQRADVPATRDPWGHRHDCAAATSATEGSSKIFGCSFHHEYGGWFAFRGVIIFPGVEYDQLEYRDPPDPLNGDPDLIIKLLNEYNFNWKTWKFRDLIDVKERYNRAFMNYLSLPPGKERRDLVKKWWHILKNCEKSEIGNFCVDEFCNGGELLDWGMG